jgi:3-hydroxyacyl-[acyl-carrier-protein] dehydratase
LVLEVLLERSRAGIFKFNGVIRVGQDVACEADLMCTMRTVA